MPDLTTSYLGLKLAHPLLPSASPLTSTLTGLESLAEAGAPAVVLGSLFEEQVDLQHELMESMLHQGSDSYGEALSYFPSPETYTEAADDYVELVHAARRRLDIPVIASLNGTTPGGWVRYARKIERAGAHALELNLFQVPADPLRSGTEVEADYLAVVKAVREQIEIPLAVKLGPFFSSPAHFARRLCEAGADGLVLFNRFYQCDFDLDQLELVPRLELSRPYEMLMPLTWIAVLFGRVEADLALTGGVGSHLDALKALMAGARVVQLASELLRFGPPRLGEMLAGLVAWLEEREYRSVAELQGSMSQRRVTEPAAYMRANYLRTLQSWRR
ncbi:MAG: dihydroorotate dehydrogenase-like protein [Candidatus Eremiobacterota bacterium]